MAPETISTPCDRCADHAAFLPLLVRATKLARPSAPRAQETFLWSNLWSVEALLARSLKNPSKYWWAREDSNLQPDRYERSALTIELQARFETQRRRVIADRALRARPWLQPQQPLG